MMTIGVILSKVLYLCGYNSRNRDRVIGTRCLELVSCYITRSTIRAPPHPSLGGDSFSTSD
jgi:hypothetical protein